MDTQYEKLKGDPELLERKGQEYQRIAEAILDAATALDAIALQCYESEALEASAQLAAGVAKDIRRATARYQATGEALEKYSGELRRIQDDAEPVVDKIETLNDQIYTQDQVIASIKDERFTAQLTGDQDEVDRLTTKLSTAKSDLDELESALTAQQDTWDGLREEKDTAASAAAAHIKDVTGGKRSDGLSDSGWDKVGRVLGEIGKVIKILCDIAAILAIFLAWVPVLGQILLIMAAVSAILAIVDAAIKLYEGEIGFGEFLGELFLGVLTLYGGKVLGLMAKRLQKVIVNGLPRGVDGTGSAYAIRLVSERLPGQLDGMKAILKSPFMRSTTDNVRYLKALKGAPRGEILIDALKQTNPFKLKNWDKFAKFDGDVAGLVKLVSKTHQHIDPAVLKKALTLTTLEGIHSVYKNYDSLSKFFDPDTNVNSDFGLDLGEEILSRLGGPFPKAIQKISKLHRTYSW